MTIRSTTNSTGGGVQSVTLKGERFIILPEAEYCRLTGEPPLPAPDESGNYPAAEALDVSIARSILRDRRRLGLSQAELARRAGIRPETLNRIERGTHSPSVATIDKLDRALAEAEQQSEPKPEKNPQPRRRTR
jgi:ribosome-binding protein aMBF1 (putative translation factor)